jgi:hypothetical protein
MKSQFTQYISLDSENFLRNFSGKKGLLLPEAWVPVDILTVL